MRIFINGQEIDFKLEQEKTLLDVIRSLEQWLHNQKLLITSFEIDKKEYTQKDIEEQGQTPIGQYQEIKISASDFLQIEINGLVSLKLFFMELKEALNSLNENKLNELLVRFPSVHATLPFLLSLEETAEGEQKRARLEKIFTGTTFGMIKMWDDATKADALSICDYFFTELDKKSASFASIGETSTKITKEMLAKLRDIVARLSEVSILLQTGKDSEAMQAIVAFSDMTLLFLRLITDFLRPQNTHDFSIEGESFENYSRALNILLRDLIEAFEKKDFIMIGDLCEYEIAPKILKLIDHVEWVLPA